MVMKVVQTNINTHSYSIFKLDSLKMGEVLTFSLFIKKEKNYVLIIEAGTLLTPKLYERLKNQKNLYISNREKSNQLLSPASLKYHVLYNKNDYQKVLNFLYSINALIFKKYFDSKEDKIDIDSIESLLFVIIDLIQDDKQYLKETMPYFINKFELNSHSLHVAIYAINLGILLGFNAKELLVIGKAALLHDIGIKKIDSSIIENEGIISFEELEAVQKHAELSAKIVRQNNVTDKEITDAISQHHENHDGSGYPHHLKSAEISDFASIISISEVFDALTNDRPHRAAYGSFDALKLMLQDETMANRFKTEYLQLFLHSL